MDSRCRYAAAIAVTLALLGASAFFGLANPPEGKVRDCRDCNVIIIVLDAARRDHFGAYGYPKDTTPNINALAAESYVFDNVISQATRTKPSVASIFTSLYPSRHGVSLMYGDEADPTGHALPDDVLTLAETFKNRSYKTYGLVRNGNIGPELNFGKGFDEYALVKDNAQLNDRMSGLIDRMPGQGRFFIYLHYFAPHAPYLSPNEYSTRFVEDGYSKVNTSTQKPRDYLLMNLSESQLSYVVSQYDGKLAYADSLVGMVLGRLRERGLLNRTLIVVTADHGEDFLDHPGLFGHGWEPYETQVRVPLILWDPASKSPSRIAGQARIVDIMPTLIDLSGGSVPEGLDGVSLRPALLGQDMRLPAYSENILGGDQDTLAVRLGNWKLICNLVDGNLTGCRLYGLEKDPGEKAQINGEEDVKRRLTDQLREYYKANMRLRPAGPGKIVLISNETAEELRALGYAG